MKSISEIDIDQLIELLSRYQVKLKVLHKKDKIPYSFFGGKEPGVKGSTIYASPDSPVQGVLHELGHLAMIPMRLRHKVKEDVSRLYSISGKRDRENEEGACVLQICLAPYLTGYGGRQQMLQDMNDTNYALTGLVDQRGSPDKAVVDRLVRKGLLKRYKNNRIAPGRNCSR